MKTLDEVIEILEKVVKHDYVWFDEKTALMTIETLTDTLQYLRELRDMTDIPMEYFESGGTLQNFADTSQITCPKCHSEFLILPDANNPLTWDELKSMEGKPVWVELQKCGNHWVIITDDLSNGLVCRDMFGINVPLYKDRIGKTWNAYRKERK